MKRYFKKGFLILVAAFVVLFGLRLGYGYLFADDGSLSGLNDLYESSNTGSANFEFVKKNYASEKMKYDRRRQPAAQCGPKV